jgi:serine O-acetyltransferase
MNSSFSSMNKRGKQLKLKQIMEEEKRTVYIYRRIHEHTMKKHILRRKCWKIIRFLFANKVFIDERAEIGENFKIVHAIGIAIGAATIGANCTIYQNVTIGANYEEDSNRNKFPIIGDNVRISPGAVILGPIKIGSNTIVGANSVVTKDFPDNSVIGGIPCKILSKYDPERFGK